MTILQPHQQRVVDEKSDLDGRLEKLISFFASPLFSGLELDEQARLKRQAEVMGEYSTILGERISRF